MASLVSVQDFPSVKGLQLVLASVLLILKDRYVTVLFELVSTSRSIFHIP